jgi:predicted ATPase
VAQLGAVIGREFSRDLLAMVAAMPEVELQRCLERLVAVGLLHRTTSLGREAYSFAHALVRDAAYDSLLRSRRRQLHARVAQALEQAFPLVAVDAPELLAHHYTEAGLAGPALDYWRRAGERAVQRYANAEAIGHLRRALRLLAGLPAGPERDRAELVLQTALGAPLIASKGYSAPEVQQAYTRARELCRGFNDAPALFPVLLGLGLFYLVRSALPAAWPLAAQCLAAAREARDDDLLLEACGLAGAVELYRGKLVAARTLLERGLTLYRPDCHREHAARYGQDPLNTLAFVARTHALLGHPDLARQRGEALLALTREPAVQPNSLAAMHAHLAHLYLVLRDAPAALLHAEAVVAVALQQDLPLWLGLGRMYGGAALVEDALPGGACPQVTDGVAEGLEGLAAYRASGAGLDVPTCLCWFAAGHARLGRPAAGLRLLDEARRVITDTGEAYFAAELHRLKGMALLSPAGPDRAGAEACFSEAMAIARAQSARMWELRSATSLARLWAEQGERRRAHDMLAPIYGWFTEGFDTPDLQEAKALLNELAPAPKATSGYVAPRRLVNNPG